MASSFTPSSLLCCITLSLSSFISNPQMELAEFRPGKLSHFKRHFKSHCFSPLASHLSIESFQQWAGVIALRQHLHLVPHTPSFNPSSQCLAEFKTQNPKVHPFFFLQAGSLTKSQSRRNDFEILFDKGP